MRGIQTTDKEQEIVINANDGEFLTLAPPGCGKTHVLARRIIRAHDAGIPFSEMLCLTFTNRAARSMKQRIAQQLNAMGSSYNDERNSVGSSYNDGNNLVRSSYNDEGNLISCNNREDNSSVNFNSSNEGDNLICNHNLTESINDIFVGNIHRFCARFLLDNALIPADTGIIDDDDILSILAHYLDLDETVVAGSFKLRRQCFDAVHLAAMMHQIEHLHPKELRIHPDCLTADDLAALRYICEVQELELTPSVMTQIYLTAADYQTVVKSYAYRADRQPALKGLLDKMEAALYYRNYKRDARLIDFEDMLLLTYDALAKEAGLTSGTAGPFKHFTWCQVDEVQDLNPLQIRIIDLLMKPAGTPQRTMMFLGDEQQAIFSFMGAKTAALEQLKTRCGGRIFHLATNHRSPQYLLDVFNRYAENILHIDPALLPAACYDGERTGDELTIVCSPTLESEYSDAALEAARLANEYPEETTAVIVLTNAEADIISSRMDEAGVRHFKVSGADLFATPEVKFLIAHAAVFANEHNFIAWSRLFTGMRIYERGAAARAFLRKLVDVSLTPLDLMLRPDSSYIMDFARIFEEKEIVVFDTETTGLDTARDDIIQIAAVKMRRGKIVKGSEFSVHIATNRPIPAMLGTIVNPIIEERKHVKILPPEEALALFANYLGSSPGCVLLGHNAAFDYAILDANLQRFLPEYDLKQRNPDCFDTLKLARLLFPQLRQFKLKYLLEEFRLKGENSHLADADTAATCSLAVHCYKRCKKIIPLQKTFLAGRTVRAKADLLRTRLLPLYRATSSRLNKLQPADGEPLLAAELRNLYAYLLKQGFLREVKNIEYVFRYIARETVTPADSTLAAQIANHILDISTLRESDLCAANILDERVIISTVHKAKGLEFDNVIVFDAADDRYPSFRSAADGGAGVAEDSRKLYVALSRARRRIVLFRSAEKITRTRHISRAISPFLAPVLPLFEARFCDENQGLSCY